MTFNPSSAASRIVVFAVLMGALSFGAQAQNIEREWQAGEKAYREEKYDDAITHFTRVVSTLQKPELRVESKMLADAFAARADAHYGAQHWKLAVADYSRCIELNPKNASAYAFRGVARKAASGDYDGFIADAEMAAKLDPEWAYLVEDAHSTVTWRRAMQGFLILGGIVMVLGIIPLARGLTRLIKAGV